MKTSIINGSEVSRLSVAIQTSDGNHPLDAYPAAKVKSSVALPYGTDLSTHLACPGEQLSCMSHYRGLVWISKIIVRQGQ